MAKLHFYYSAMNAGKSTVLLQSSYNYQERGMKTLRFKPQIDKRFHTTEIISRIGLSETAYCFDPNFNFFQYVQEQLAKDPAIKCILIDEAQFLTKNQVYQLCQITDDLKVPVLAYGLRSDFQMQTFEGSQYLLAWADQLIEIKTICHCGKKATMNLRIDQSGNPVVTGAQVEIGGNERYTAVCRRHMRMAHEQQHKVSMA